MLGKNTILKAIHNKARGKEEKNQVWMLGKNTILKAIHNLQNFQYQQMIGVNAG